MGRIIKLSIIVPVYNEEQTVGEVLGKLDHLVLSGIEKEIVVVDDGSTDKTAPKIERYIKSRGNSKIKLIKHIKNQGKGKGIRTGIKSATGDFVIIQDADLEYEPSYIPILLEPIIEERSEVVYGTRLKRLPDLKRDENTARFLLHYFGNRFLSVMISLLFSTWLTDIETGYKIFPRRVFNKLNIKSTGFEFEPEITIKLLKRGYKIIEIPIRTIPRSYSEGKKLNTFRDGTKALWTILKYRFT